MSKPAFGDLVEKIRPYMPNGTSPKARSDSVSVEVSLSVTLRYLAGGSYLDICDIHHITEPTFFRVKSRTLVALDFALQDEIRFPSTEDERRDTASGFEVKTGGVMKGCLGALDGLAVKIKEPSLFDCPNPTSYRNRKGFFAVLVQAICDSKRLFTFASVECQGSCHDSTAFDATSFSRCIQSLVPFGYWIAADDAYACSEQVITPFSGSHSRDSEEDAFNYWHSSAQRINIEYECEMCNVLFNNWRLTLCLLVL